MQGAQKILICRTPTRWDGIKNACYLGMLCFLVHKTQQQMKHQPVAMASAMDIVVKRLPTMATSTKAPDCPGEGLLAGVGRFEGLASAVRARQGAKAVLAELTSIKNVVLMAKTCIRYISSPVEY